MLSNFGSNDRGLPIARPPIYTATLGCTLFKDALGCGSAPAPLGRTHPFGARAGASPDRPWAGPDGRATAGALLAERPMAVLSGLKEFAGGPGKVAGAAPKPRSLPT
jgi:hypothetical protein